MTNFVSPNYENAPLIEVALSVQFNQKPQFAAAHAGIFWSRIRSTYPIAQEQSPLVPIDEVFGPVQMSSVGFQVGFPGTCHWFLTEDGNFLVQVQRDRLALNWRKLANQAPYPRYEGLIERFGALFREIDQFFVESTMGACEINMCEVSYINQWFFEKNQKFSDGVGSWLKLAPSNSASLEMEAANIAARYLVHADNGAPIGRLYVNVSPIFDQSGSMGINLELTCRVRPIPNDKPYLTAMDLAHRHVVNTFKEITSDAAQKRWRG